jgi:hypothetical protein
VTIEELAESPMIPARHGLEQLIIMHLTESVSLTAHVVHGS